MKHLCGRAGERDMVPCVVCEVVEDNQEKAFNKGQCGAVSEGVLCDRESGHAGDHRGYIDQHDAVVLWRQQAITSDAELLAALKLLESAYRLNVVAVGEPSSVLAAAQAAIAKAEHRRKVQEGA